MLFQTHMTFYTLKIHKNNFSFSQKKVSHIVLKWHYAVYFKVKYLKKDLILLIALFFRSSWGYDIELVIAG